MPTKLTTQQFIDKAISVHGTYYNYDKVDYINAHTKVTIFCPQHGQFSMKPNNHLSGQQGCPHCGITANSKSRTKTTKSFIEELHLTKKQDIFDLSKVVYIDAKTPVEVKHLPCGSTHFMLPSSLLRAKTCAHCSIEKLTSTKKDSNKKVVEKNIEKIKENYLIKSDYVDSKTHILVEHKPCGHTFQSTPDNLLRNQGCPSCANHGYDQSKPGYLYYLSIDDGTYYKIGITNRSVKERFTNSDLARITTIKEAYFANGIEPLQRETKILQLSKEYLYKGLPILSSGNSELLTKNIIELGLINETYFTEGAYG